MKIIENNIISQDDIINSFNGDSDLLKLLNIPDNYEDIKTHLSLTIYGSHLDISKQFYDSLDKTDQDKYLKEQIMSKLNRLGRQLVYDIFKSDSNISPNSMDGLNKKLALINKHIIGNQLDLVDFNTLPKKSDRIKAVSFGVGYNPSGIKMNTKTNRSILLESIDTAISIMNNNIDIIATGMGGFQILKNLLNENPSTVSQIELLGKKRVYLYNNIPIIQIQKDSLRNEIINFNELSPDRVSNNDCTSIYLIKFGIKNNYGAIRYGNISISDPCFLDDYQVFRWKILYFFNHIIKNHRSVIRIGGIRR